MMGSDLPITIATARMNPIMTVAVNAQTLKLLEIDFSVAAGVAVEFFYLATGVRHYK
jgi:hypothetical protein